MSADNAILVLVLTDGYRVIHAQAIENLKWSIVENKEVSHYVPSRIFDYFSGAKPVFTKEEKTRKADEVFNNYGYVEYGIQEINLMPYSWHDILEMARSVIEDEIDFEEGRENRQTLEYLYETKFKIINQLEELQWA